jgi:hypothetical protein
VSLAEHGRFVTPMMEVDVGDLGNAEIAFGRERVERSWLAELADELRFLACDKGIIHLKWGPKSDFSCQFAQ